jgi:hypothetical protein
VSELDLVSLFSGTESARKRQERDGKLEALDGELGATTAERAKVYRLFVEEKLNSTFVGSKIQELDARILRLQADVATAKNEKAEADSGSAARSQEAKDTETLIHRLRNAGEQTFENRARLAMRLHTLISEISLDPGGPDRPEREDWTDDMRGFVVVFKDGEMRSVVSNRIGDKVFSIRTRQPMIDQ